MSPLLRPVHRAALASVGLAALMAASLTVREAKAQSFTIAPGQTVTTQRTLSGTNTGTIANTGTLSVGGNTVSLLINGPATGVTLNNDGTLTQTGTGRAIDISGGSTTRSFTITNSATGIIRSTANDTVRVNTAVTGSTITIDNSGLIQSGGTGYAGLGQALDLRAITATSGNFVSILNRAGGIIEALTDDAVRPGQNVSIQNWGTIRSFGANTSGGSNGTADGIDAGGRTGITVTNNAGALISGARHGITADTDITVTNFGTITGRNGSGVGSDGNGTVTNYGTITGAYAGAGNIFNSDGTASLNGDGDGVDIDFIGTVRNFGIIQGIGAGGVDSGGRPNGSEGIAMGGGTIENNAGALISGAARGILIDDGALGPGVAATTITNAGTIQGLGGAAIGMVGNYANSITNSGTISGGGTEAAIFINGNGNNSIVNSGTISTSGSAQALFLNGSGNNSLANSGTIATSGAGIAVQFGDGNNLVTNSGAIRAASATGTALLFGNGGNTLTNQGSILGGVSFGSGVNSVVNSGSLAALVFNGNGNNTLVNTGTIATSGTGAAVQFGDGNNTVTSSGSINAASASGTALRFGNGNNSLTIQGGSILGDVVAGSGTNTLTFALGSGNFVLGGSYSGFTTAVVQSGRLSVNGSLQAGSGLTVASGATLGGTGSVPSTTVFGTIAPGNSIGTLTVNGNLTLANSSTTVIEVQGTSSDRIVVNGSATLGGSLKMVSLGSGPVFTTPYQIVSAANGVSGSFASFTADSGFGVAVLPTLGVGAGGITLTLTPAPLLASLPGTAGGTPILGTASRNVAAVGLALDRAAASGANVSPLYPVYASANRADLVAALSSLSGEVHASAPALGYRLSDSFLKMMLDPTAAGRSGALIGGGASDFTADLPAGKSRMPSAAPIVRVEPNYNAWAAVSAQSGRVDGQALRLGTADTRLTDGSVAAGVDLRLMPGSFAGFALSGGRAESKLSGGRGSADGDAFQAGLYGTTRLGPVDLSGALSYGSLWVETRRAIPVLGQSASADYRADVFAGRLQASYALVSGAGYALSPYAALQAQSVRMPGFREVGGTGSLTGFGRDATALRSELGLKGQVATQLGGRALTLFGEVAWAHDFRRDLTFAGALTAIPTASFTVAGARRERDAALVGAGFDYRLAPNATLGGRLDGSLAADSRSFGGTASLKVSF